MSDDIRRELQALKDLATSLTDRIRLLEQRLASSSVVASPRSSKQTERAQTVSDRTQEGQLESRIGRFWLQWIGMGILVLGVTFFILYTFKYLGAGAKIAIGYAVGGGLLWLGGLIERQQHLAWYGRGLRGGGWAVAYVTTYAMHHVPATRILQDPTAAFLLLLLVTIAAVSSALRRRSQLEAGFAFLLGFLTTFVSHVSSFTLGSSALLTIAIVGIVVRMRWLNLCLCGAIGSHVTQMALARRLIGLNLISSTYVEIAIAQFWLNTAFMALYWAAYSYAVFTFGKEDRRNRWVVMTTVLMNSVLFGFQALSSTPKAYWDERYLAPLALGVTHLLLSLVAHRRGAHLLKETNTLLGLAWATISIPLKLTDQWTECLWSLEITVLVWLGLRFRQASYRLFAAVLACVLAAYLLVELTSAEHIPLLGYHLSRRLVTVLMAVMAYALAAATYRLNRFQAVQRPAERWAFHAYTIATSFFLTCLLGAEAAPRWLSLSWTMEGLGLLALGFTMKDRVLRMCGLLVFALLVVKILFVDLAQFDTSKASTKRTR